MVVWTIVYVAEAHAEDEWPVGNQYNKEVRSLKQTHTLKGRIQAAQSLVKEFHLSGIRILVDDPKTNEFHTQFQPWPLRWYVFRKDRQCLLVSKPQDAMQY